MPALYLLHGTAFLYWQSVILLRLGLAFTLTADAYSIGPVPCIAAPYQSLSMASFATISSVVPFA